jgi:hypothetical protein
MDADAVEKDEPSLGAVEDYPPEANDDAPAWDEPADWATHSEQASEEGIDESLDPGDVVAAEGQPRDWYEATDELSDPADETETPVGEEGDPAAVSPKGEPRDLPEWAQGYDSDDDVDESVRDYIARLLDRVGGDSQKPPLPQGGKAVSSQPPSLDKPSGPSPAKSEPVAPEAEESPAASSEPVEPAIEEAAGDVYVPRSLPPERTTNIGAMRELANISAEAAIRCYEKNQAAKSFLEKSSIALVALGCGVFLLYWAITYGHITMYMGAAAAFTAAAVAAWQVLMILLRWLSLATSPNQSATNAPAEQEADSGRAT